MKMNVLNSHPRTPPGSDLIAVAFGVTTAMWALLYVCLMPGLHVPGLVVIGVIGICPLAGGWVLGRLGGRGPGGAAGAGLIIATVNFLITASLIGSHQEKMASGMIWVGGFSVAMVVLSVVGAAACRRRHNAAEPWVGHFALVAVATTAMLIAAGGVVTGLEAGLAVPDWPNTFGHKMIFYPLSLMQRDGHVYAEHTHRLWGMLVGLTSIVLMVQVWRADRRPGPRWLAVAIFLAISGQGVLGGQRVVLKNLNMAMVHGIGGQLILALLVVLAVVSSRAWFGRAQQSDSAATDRALGFGSVAALVVQLVLGAMVRHLPARPVMLHVTVAAVVFVLILAAGLRIWGLHGQKVPALRRLALAAMALVVLQVALGVGALIVTAVEPTSSSAVAADVIVTSAHQFNGALLLAATVAMAMLTGRRVEPADLETERTPASASTA